MKSKPFTILCILIFATQLCSYSQLQLYPTTNINVSNGINNLTNAWAGGINNAQISNVDLNYDGKKDLFIFDRARNLSSVYLSDGNDYIYAPTYTDSFPNLTSWAFLIDFNKDGKIDIFTSNATLTQNKNSLKVYKNIGNGNLQFSILKDEVQSKYYGNVSSLYVTGSDIPSFSDVDNDGDIDIITFDVSGNAIEYHANNSVEVYGSSDSLNYVLTNACWGNVREDPFSNALTLGVTCPAITLKTELHSGSTLLAYDADGDGDKDLIIGDLLFNALAFASNGGNLSNANFTSEDTSFPSYNSPVNLASFPAAFLADVDQNSKNDLLIAPNNKGDENYNCLHYYKNTSSNNVDHFELQQKDFLVNTMLDFGSGAYPVFFDYNSDGLQDILVANDGIYDVNQSKQIGKMALLINIGTTNSPAFILQESDVAKLSQYAITAMKPTFGDMDNDGDNDMLIGAFNGQIHYFKNNAGAGNTANFVIQTPIYQSIDVGNYSTPQLFDIDNDGLLDLLIGEQDGNINYYKNTGSAASPFFTLQSTNFGNVNVSESFLSGYSVPLFFKNDNNTELLVGCANGKIQHFNNIDGNLNGSFALQSAEFSNIRLGAQSSVAMYKLSNNKFSLLAGNKSGGLQLFTEMNGNNVEEIVNNYLLHSYYAQQKINLSFDENIRLQNISIFNILGEEVLQKSLSENDKNIDVKALPAGCYFSKINFTKNGINYFAFLKFIQ